MFRFGTRETDSYGQLLYWLLSVVQSRFSQMVLASVHMAFGSVLGHWDLGQSNVISCHLGKALSILFRAPEETIFGRGTLHQELKQRTLFSFGH